MSLIEKNTRYKGLSGEMKLLKKNYTLFKLVREQLRIQKCNFRTGGYDAFQEHTFQKVCSFGIQDNISSQGTTAYSIPSIFFLNHVSHFEVINVLTQLLQLNVKAVFKIVFKKL